MTRRHDLGETVDAVVIGTGAGGAPLAARLAEAGLSVVALEAGKVFVPRDHTPNETDADIYWLDERLSGGETPTAFGANNSGKLFLESIRAVCISACACCRTNSTSMTASPSARARVYFAASRARESQTAQRFDFCSHGCGDF